MAQFDPAMLQPFNKAVRSLSRLKTKKMCELDYK